MNSKNKFNLVENNYEIYYFHIINLLKKNYVYQEEIYILDFGCGSGKMLSYIEKLKDNNDFKDKRFFLYGVDIFKNYQSLNDTRQKSKLSTIKSIKPYERFEFGKKFDIIISNQVFEHINNLDDIYLHLSSLLNEKGIILAGFPTKEIIVEPHLRIPFIHWLRKYSKLLYFYLYLSSVFKIGQFKKNFSDNKQKNIYLKNRFNYCNENIFYRNYEEHAKLIKNYFSNYQDITNKYILILKVNKHFSNFIKKVILLIPSRNFRNLIARSIFGIYLIIKK